MRKIALILLISLPVTAFPQTVTVDQKFVDLAARAGREVIAQRELNTALQAVIDAQKGQIDAQLKEILVKDEKAQLQQQVVDSQASQIKTLAAIKCDQTRLFWGIISKKRCR